MPDTSDNVLWRCLCLRIQVDGHEVFVLFHRGGYGGDGRADCHIAAGEALCPDWKGDNSGPRSEADIRAQWAKISVYSSPFLRLYFILDDRFRQHCCHRATFCL